MSLLDRVAVAAGANLGQSAPFGGPGFAFWQADGTLNGTLQPPAGYGSAGGGTDPIAVSIPDARIYVVFHHIADNVEHLFVYDDSGTVVTHTALPSSGRLVRALYVPAAGIVWASVTDGSQGEVWEYTAAGVFVAIRAVLVAPNLGTDGVQLTMRRDGDFLYFHALAKFFGQAGELWRYDLVHGGDCTQVIPPIPVPPTNTSCGTGTPVAALPYTATVNPKSAPLDPIVPSCGSGDANNATWWTVTVPAGVTHLYLSTCGSDYDTMLAAYRGACGALAEIACNDDDCDVQSNLDFTVTPGEVIHVLACAFSHETDDIRLVFRADSAPLGDPPPQVKHVQGGVVRLTDGRWLASGLTDLPSVAHLTTVRLYSATGEAIRDDTFAPSFDVVGVAEDADGLHYFVGDRLALTGGLIRRVALADGSVTASWSAMVDGINYGATMAQIFAPVAPPDPQFRNADLVVGLTLLHLTPR